MQSCTSSLSPPCYSRVVHGVPVVLLGDLGEVLELGAVLLHMLAAGVAEHLRRGRARRELVLVQHRLDVPGRGQDQGGKREVSASAAILGDFASHESPSLFQRIIDKLQYAVVYLTVF